MLIAPVKETTRPRMRELLMDDTAPVYARAADLRIGATRYRRLAALYQPDVAAVLMSMAKELEAAGDALEDGNRWPNLLRPPYFPEGLAS